MGSVSIEDQVHFIYISLEAVLLFDHYEKFHYPIIWYLSYLGCHDELKIVNCTASSGLFGSNWGCDKVYSDNSERSWEIATDDQTSPWIQVDLAHGYELHQLRIKQRENDEYRFKQVDIKFSNEASSLQYDLPNHAEWIQIILPKATMSQFVKITRTTSMRSPDKGGLHRIKAFGCRDSNYNPNIAKNYNLSPRIWLFGLIFSHIPS